MFNRAQNYVHNRIEKQKAETGKVRVVLVKGRQQGMSTYVNGRYYHRSSLNPGVGVFILAHIADSTRALFKMVGRFYDRAPEAMKPPVKVSNQRNLEFAELNSEYAIGTAGSADIGRGMTVQCLHGSEVGFWPNSDDIVTGLLQAIPNSDGSEIILESTANGIGNLFHKLAMQGLTEDSDFQTIFVPWYWQEEYRQQAPETFVPTEEEQKLMDQYKLDEDQIFWRRRKIQDIFGGDVWKFQREYPMTLQEAFVTSGERLLDARAVMAAAKSNLHDRVAPVVMGVDPARSGDRTAIVLRRGREIFKIKKYSDMNAMRLAGVCAKLIDHYNVTKCFIDVGLGYGTLDKLHESGYTSIVTGVHFGEQAMEREIFANKRAEMADALAKWFLAGASIPDDEEFINDLMAIPPLEQTTGRGVLKLPPKQKIIEEYGKSPDLYDAAKLTFAYPVAPRTAKNRIKREQPSMKRRRSPLITVRNFAGGDKNKQRVYRQDIDII